jgi:ADP-heptose:LPS heptosyltransferase
MSIYTSVFLQCIKNFLAYPVSSKRRNKILIVSNGPSFGDLIHTIPVIRAFSVYNDVSVLTTPGYEVKGFKYVSEEEALNNKWDLTFVCDDKHKVRWKGNTVYCEANRVVSRILRTWKEYNWSDFFLDISRISDYRLLNIPYRYSSIKSTGEKIIIHPGASSEGKAWGLDNYLNLYNNLKTAGYKPEILVTKFDNFVLNKLKGSKYKMIKANNTDDLADIAGSTKLFIGNDSGVMHFFGLYDCDVLGVFTYGCAETHYPWTPRGFVYFERAVFEDFYKRGVVSKINLDVAAATKETLNILKAGKLTGKNDNFFSTRSLVNYPPF